MVEMGTRLKAVREAGGHTQDEFGKVCAVGVSTISGWESGRNQIDVIALARLADAFGFTTDWVARGDIAGLRFDLAVKLQAHIRAAAGAVKPSRGRPRKPRPEAAPPTVAEAPEPVARTGRRVLHETATEFVPANKFT